MAQMTPEVSKLSVDEGVQSSWEAEIGKRIAELGSGTVKTTPWEEVRGRNLAKLPHAQ